MDPVDNNQFEVVAAKSKRKIAAPCTNVYLNPALDLLANEDPMCNTAMEIVPIKRRKRTRSCDIVAFENSALDLGISKAAVNEFLARELANVQKNVRPYRSTEVSNYRANLPDITLTSGLGVSNLQINETKTKNVQKVRPYSFDVGDAFEPYACEPSLNFSSIVFDDKNPMKTVNITEDILHSHSSNSAGCGFESDNVPKDVDTTCPPEVPPRNASLQYKSLENGSTRNPEQSMPYLQTDIDDTCQNMSVINEIGIPYVLNESEIVINNVSHDIITEASNAHEIPQNPMEITEDMKGDVCPSSGDVQGWDDDDTNRTDIDSGISDLEQKSIIPTDSDLKNLDVSAINKTTNIQTNITNQVFVNSPTNLSLSFIDRLALNSPNISNPSLCLDDDLNESNIMEIKTITIITKTKRVIDKKKNTNPFLDPNLEVNIQRADENPFVIQPSTMQSNTVANTSKPEPEYNDDVLNRPAIAQVPQVNNLMPRRLFASETNSTISTVNDSINIEQHEYENIDDYRSESPIYENVCDDEPYFNKQSKILGQDVSQFSAVDIMNLNKNSRPHSSNNADSSNDSNQARKDLKHQILKASKLPKKVLKKLKKTFKGEKTNHNVTLNPYEVPRKLPKQKEKKNESGIENPALNLDNSDEIEVFEENEESDDGEHQYETIKTLRNTRLNMNVTPLKERAVDNIDISHNKTGTPGKKVRFDSTLNQEKVITGNSFDYGIQSPGFDDKIDNYHNELENCINERKFLEQNM